MSQTAWPFDMDAKRRSTPPHQHSADSFADTYSSNKSTGGPLDDHPYTGVGTSRVSVNKALENAPLLRPSNKHIGNSGGHGGPHRRAVSDLSTLEYTVRWFLVFCLGVGTLLPWNTILSSSAFYSSAFPKGVPADVWFTWVFQFIVLVVLVLQVTYGATLSLSARFIAGYLIYVVGLSSFFAAVYFLSGHANALVISNFVVAFIGIGDGLTEGTLYGLCGRLGGFHGAAQSGQAFSGVFVTGLSIITAYVYPDTPKGIIDGTFVYFVVCCSVAVLCLGLAYALSRLPSVDAASVKKVGSVNRWEIYKSIWPFSLTIMLVYGVTLSVFPSMLIQVPSSSKSLSSGMLGLLLIEAFNVGDWFTKLTLTPQSLSCFGRINPYVLLVGAVLRSVFIPVFFLYGISKLPGNNTTTIVLSLCLGLTNGTLSGLTMGSADRDCSEEEKDTADYIMMFSLASGITLGLFAAIPLNLWLYSIANAS